MRIFLVSLFFLSSLFLSPSLALPPNTEVELIREIDLGAKGKAYNYEVTKGPCYSEEELKAYLTEAGLVKVIHQPPHPTAPFEVRFVFLNEEDTERELWVTDIRTGGSHFCIKGYGKRETGEAL